MQDGVTVPYHYAGENEKQFRQDFLYDASPVRVYGTRILLHATPSYSGSCSGPAHSAYFLRFHILPLIFRISTNMSGLSQFLKPLILIFKVNRSTVPSSRGKSEFHSRRWERKQTEGHVMNVIRTFRPPS
jgi:hypothetical protein